MGGSYTYGDSAHLDAATAITGSSTSYTASYDAAGDMTCRAPTSSTTCSGTQTGAQLTYDNERRLATWQNAPGNTPTSSTSNLYDGEGHRVEQQVTNGGATTTVTYIGQLEELSTTAGTTTTTTYYYAGGKRIAQVTNGAFSYLGSDGLGSAEVALDGSGNVQASVLYDPYGNVRYSSGTMPGSYGYTGQRADAATGLDYYNARYYDPVAGQFTSSDSTAGDGLNRYAYVRGNPETATDPTGLRCVADGSVCPVGGSNGGGTSNPPPPPHSGCQSNCGGKGPSGGQTSCRVNDEQAGCQAWRIWYEGTDPGKLGGALLVRHDATNNLRLSARPYFILGLVFDLGAFIVELAGGFNFGNLIKSAFVVVNAVVDVMSLWASIDPDHAEQWYALGSAASKIAALLHGVMAMVSGIAWWMAWTINGIYAAAKISVEGLSTVLMKLLIAAAGNVIEAVSDLALAHGYSILGDAAAQDNMPVWDWCDGPGKGQCASEPNGGMPEAGRP